MGFTVNLTIRGLCALIPSQPLQFEDPEKPGQPRKDEQLIDKMTVLVMDATEPEVISNRDPETPVDLEVCSHLPLLRFPRGSWVLHGDRIEILADLEPGLLRIAPSFEKWASMERVLVDQARTNQNVARIDSKFLDPVPPPPPEIAGILELKAGTVKADRFMGFWDFRPFPPQQEDIYADRLASEVQVSIPIQQDQAVLRATARDGSIREQVLAPKTAGNASVNLLISNLCFGEEELPRLEGDFAVFYKLLTNYQGVKRIPQFRGGPKPGGGQGAAGPGTVPGPANESPSCAGIRQ